MSLYNHTYLGAVIGRPSPLTAQLYRYRVAKSVVRYINRLYANRGFWRSIPKRAVDARINQKLSMLKEAMRRFRLPTEKRDRAIVKDLAFRLICMQYR